MRTYTLAAVLLGLAVALPAAAMTQYETTSEITVGSAKAERATTKTWLLADRMRVEGPTDILIVRADRAVVWLADRKSKTYREYTLESLRKVLQPAQPGVSGQPPFALGTKTVGGAMATGSSFTAVAPMAAADKTSVPVTWQVDLWAPAKPAETAAAYDALNARLASLGLPLVSLRAALVAADPQAAPLLVSYARATAALGPALAKVAGIPLSTTVAGMVLPPGTASLPPDKRQVLLTPEGGGVRLLLIQSTVSGLRAAADDPRLFDLPDGYKKAGQ